MVNKTENNWQQIIDDFFIEKTQKERAKTIKAELDKLKKEIKDEEVQKVFKLKKAKEISDYAFQQGRFDTIKKILMQKGMLSYLPDLSEKFTAIDEKFEPNKWIDEAAKKLPQFSSATHAPRLTHSSIPLEVPSFVDNIKVTRVGSLTTSCLKFKHIDGIRNNADAQFYDLSQLEYESEKLAYAVSDPSNKILDPYSKDDCQLQSWKDSFAESLKPKKLTTHHLVKQVYFPIDFGRDEYHLLCNTVSSSLAHAIFENNNLTKFGRDKRKANKYFNKEAIIYPKRASLYVTQSNHGNATKLNGERGGRLILACCEPPQWQSQLKPPLYKNSFFYSLYSKRSVQGLSDLLATFEQAGISFTNPNRLRGLQKWVAAIFNEVLDYVSDIQMLPSGWSTQENIKLKPQHQYLLDCYRDDQSFIEKREQSEWQKTIIDDFVSWLNDRLHKANVQFTPTQKHNRQWRKIAEPMLREYVDGLILPKAANVINGNAKEVADA